MTANNASFNIGEDLPKSSSEWKKTLNRYVVWQQKQLKDFEEARDHGTLKDDTIPPTFPSLNVNSTLDDLGKANLNSASEIDVPQFLLLRALFVPLFRSLDDRSMLKDKAKVITQAALEKAEAILLQGTGCHRAGILKAGFECLLDLSRSSSTFGSTEEEIRHVNSTIDRFAFFRDSLAGIDRTSNGHAAKPIAGQSVNTGMKTRSQKNKEQMAKVEKFVSQQAGFVMNPREGKSQGSGGEPRNTPDDNGIPDNHTSEDDSVDERLVSPYFPTEYFPTERDLQLDSDDEEAGGSSGSEIPIMPEDEEADGSWVDGRKPDTASTSEINVSESLNLLLKALYIDPVHGLHVNMDNRRFRVEGKEKTKKPDAFRLLYVAEVDGLCRWETEPDEAALAIIEAKKSSKDSVQYRMQQAAEMVARIAESTRGMRLWHQAK